MIGIIVVVLICGEVMMEDWIEHEMRNWSRWCNSGPSPHPRLPGSFLGSWLIPDTLAGSSDDRAPLVHEENARKVQSVFDSAIHIERKVMQSEWLSPWQYDRLSGGIPAAARRLEISVASYETVVRSVKRRVQGVFA